MDNEMNGLNTISLSESDKLAHNAFRAFLGTAVIMGVMAIAVKFIYRADSSSALSSVIQISLVAVAALISAGLARRGQPIVGYFITVAAWQLLLLYNVTFIVAGMGLIIAALSLLLTLGLTTFILQKKYLSWAVTFSIPLAILIFAIDTFSTTTARIISSDEVIITTGIIAAIFTLIYGFLIARQFRHFSLRAKLIIAFVGISVFIVTGISFIATSVLTESLTQEVGENFEGQAKTLHREINLFFHEKVSQIQAIAAVASIKEQVTERNNSYSGNDSEILSQIQLLDEQWIAAESDDDPLITQILTTDNSINPAVTQLHDFLTAFPFHREIFVTDRYGVTLASTGRLSDYYQADEEWWQAAWNDGAGAVYISEPEFDESAGISAVLIAVPIFSANDEVIGIVRSTLAVTGLFDLVGEITLGNTGHAILLDNVGEILFDPFAGEGVGSISLPAELRQGFIQSKSHNERKFELAPDENGNDTLFGFSSAHRIVDDGDSNALHTQIDKTVRALGWVTVVRQEASEALASIANINRTIQISSLVALGLAALLAALFAHYIVGPIQRLNEATQAVGTGNLDVELPNSSSDDEVGQLVSNFSLMVDRLKSTVGNLQARTRDLDLTAEIGREVTQVQDLEQTLKDAVELIREHFELYYSQIYLTDPINRTLILRAGTGQIGQKLVQEGHRLLINLSSLNGTAAVNKQPVIVADTNLSGTFRAHLLLPHTRSEMVVPLIVGDELLGVLDLQSEQAGRFNSDQVTGFVALAAQLAIAIQNAALFSEMKRARDEVRAQARQLTAVGWQEFFNAVDQDERLVTAYGVGEDVPLSEPPTRSASAETYHLAAPITVAGANVGTIRLEDVAEREWGGNEIEIVRAVAEKIGRQVETLRLVNEGKRSQFKAEQATRRLTREGWESYLNVVELSGNGYVYNQNRVQSLTDEAPIDAVHISQPLAVRGEEFGELVLGGVDSLNGETKGLLQAVAQKVSDRMEALRLSQQSELALAQTEDQARRLAHLNELGNRLSAIVGLDEAFMIVSQQMGNIINHNRLSLTMLMPDGKRLEMFALDGEAGAIPTGAILPMVGTAVGTAVTQRQFINIPDLLDSTYLEGKQLASTGLHSALVVPLIAARGALGTLNLASSSINAFDAQDESLVQQIASLLAATIESHRLFQQAQKRASELEAVAQVGIAAATFLQPQELLQEVADLTKSSFELYHAHVYLFNSSKETLLLTAGAGEAGQQMVAEKREIPLTSQGSLVATVARTGKGEIRNYETEGEGFMPHPLLANARSEMAVAIVLGDEVLGVLDVKSEQLDYFDEATMQTLTTLASQVAVALQNARSFQQSQKTLRELDTLTRRLTHEGWDNYLETAVTDTQFSYGSMPSEKHNGSIGVEINNLDLPINIQGATIGQLTLTEPQVMTDEAASIVNEVTERLTAHIENLRLTEQTEIALAASQRQSEELSLINRVVSDVAASLDIQQSMQIVVDELIEALQLKQIRIALFNETHTEIHIVAEQFAPTNSSAMGFVIPRSKLTAQLQETKRPVIIENAQYNPQMTHMHDILRKDGIETLIIMPMVAGNEVVGTVGIDILEKGRTLSDAQMNLAETIIYQASTAVQTARLFQQTTDRAQELAVINEVAQVVAQQLDKMQLFEAVREQIKRAIPNDTFFIADYNAEKELFTFPYMFDDGELREANPMAAKPKLELTKVVKSGESIIWNRSREEMKKLKDLKLLIGNKSPTSMVFAPLRLGKRIVGVISVQNYDYHHYSQSETDLLAGVANHMAVALENIRLFSESQQRADREAMINAISQKIQEATTVQGAMQTAVSELGQALKLKKAIAELTVDKDDKENGPVQPPQVEPVGESTHE